MKKIVGICILLSGLLASCGGGSSTQDSGAFLDSLDQVSEPEMQFTQETVNEIIKTIPSPLEMTALIKQSGADFDLNMLNGEGNYENYTTNFKKALNLGVYGADLGYINIYEKPQNAIGYLRKVTNLSEDLKVGQFFDFNTIKRLADNNENLDSLIYISTSGFEKMNNYLTDRGRSEISMLVLVGGWLEALHIANEVVASKGAKNTETIGRLKERIGEQKIVLDDILLLLSVYKSDPNIAKLHESLSALKSSYDKVEITYEYAEPETKEVDGMLVIVDNSKSVITITDETIAEIKNKIQSIRTNIIS